MVQSLLVILVFAAALLYLGRMLYRSLQAKSCATGCGKCSAIDFDAIEKQVRVKS